MARTRQVNETRTHNPSTGEKPGQRYTYYETTAYTFWDDDPFGIEYAADTLRELLRDLNAERARCVKRARYIDDGYLPDDQAFSHATIKRVTVSLT